MGLTNEHVGPKILAKIKIYVLTRAELLFTLCYEIPCTRSKNPRMEKNIGSFAAFTFIYCLDLTHHTVLLFERCQPTSCSTWNKQSTDVCPNATAETALPDSHC